MLIYLAVEKVAPAESKHPLRTESVYFLCFPRLFLNLLIGQPVIEPWADLPVLGFTR